jgi:hypothetical protein
MRKFVLIAALATLTACSQERGEPVADSTPAEETALTIDAVAGAYDYTLADGTTGIMVLLADSTFTDAMAGEIVKGTWGVAGDKVCMDPDGEASDQQPGCYTLGQPDTEGVQLATGEDGSVVKIRKQPA